jgi:hypothetical protein
MRDTIDMAREAGAEFAELPMMDAFVFSVDDKHWNSKELERFVALVRADEREACAKVCEDAAEDGSEMDGYDTAYNCAATIRARGNT